MSEQIDETTALAMMRIVMSDEEPLTVQIQIRGAWMMISALQLAWRHPGISSLMKTEIENVTRQFQRAIADRYPAINDLLEKG